jgi:hypothetical protein
MAQPAPSTPVPAAQGAAFTGALPFAVGESLVFQARSSRFGKLGTGTMAVGGPEVVQGQQTWLLSFDLRARVGPTRVEEHTRSWFVPQRVASLRYQARERSPIYSRKQTVEMHPATRTWTADDGRTGESPSGAPLDELSFLYFLRTLPLAPGDSYEIDRHFEKGRNPVRVRVLGRERVEVPAGKFATVIVEMRVKDPDRYGGEGVIRLHLTDDARRIPVRIETSKPMVGDVVLSLRTHTGR